MPLIPTSLYLCTTCFRLSSHGESSQRCLCEPKHKKTDLDVPNGLHLCYICCARVAGGTTRWSWEACGICLTANEALQKEGKPALALGRHSLMNGVAGRIGDLKSKDQKAIQGLLQFAWAMGELQEKAEAQTRDLLKGIERWRNLSQIPIALWEREFAASSPLEDLLRSTQVISSIVSRC